MDNKYGTTLCLGLRRRRPRNNKPTKFKGMEGADLEAALHAMKHKTLSLEDYANVCAAVHHSGVPDAKNYMTLDVVSTILTQYHVSKGLQVFSERGVDAVLEELCQIHKRMVLEPKFAKSMSKRRQKMLFNV